MFKCISSNEYIKFWIQLQVPISLNWLNTNISSGNVAVTRINDDQVFFTSYDIITLDINESIRSHHNETRKICRHTVCIITSLLMIPFTKNIQIPFQWFWQHLWRNNKPETTESCRLPVRLYDISWDVSEQAWLAGFMVTDGQHCDGKRPCNRNCTDELMLNGTTYIKLTLISH